MDNQKPVRRILGLAEDLGHFGNQTLGHCTGHSEATQDSYIKALIGNKRNFQVQS